MSIIQLVITARKRSAWQEEGACVVGGVDDRGMHGRGDAWPGGGHVWQSRRPLHRAVRILLECIVVV